MDVHTIQIAKWRQAKKLNIDLIDTSVKSGIAAFAPTWELLLAYKNKTISEEEYTIRYRELMLRSYVTNASVWKAILEKEHIAIACYCHPDNFCHRHILVKYIEKICEAKEMPFRYLGEIA